MLAPKLDDRFKANIAAALTLFESGAVTGMSLFEWRTGTHQISATNLEIFLLFNFVIVVYYYVFVTSDRFTALLDILVTAARTGVSEDDDRPHVGRAKSGGRIQRLIANLWIPVTLNFISTVWLIHATGGLTYSAYGPVPIAMMLIGQSLYKVPPMPLRATSPIGRLFELVARVTWLYKYPLTLIFALLFGLVKLQEHWPVVSKPAPSWEVLLATLLSLLASMCVTFITRRADQAMGRRTASNTRR